MRDAAHLLVREARDRSYRSEGNIRSARFDYCSRKRSTAGFVLPSCVCDGREVALVLFAQPDALPTVEEFLHAQHLRHSSCDMAALSIAFDS
jgi:hypothetical protein